MKSIYIIGDVHGCYETLMALLNKLPNDAKLIFVGDLIDRGPDSAKVVEFVKNNNYPCVLGNHEVYMIRSHDENFKERFMSEYMNNHYLWRKNGGYATLTSYQNSLYNKKEHIEWIKELPLYLELTALKDEENRSLLVTHGVGLPFYDIMDDCEDEITTNRKMIETQWNHVVNVFGHSPYFEPKFYLNYIGIDTGCVYGQDGKEGYLTALEWPSKKIIQQKYIG
jgi:serine/threonine protein phosphatase 1